MESTEVGSADAFMGKPILMQREAAMSRFGGRGFDGAARQHRNQMRTIFGAAVEVAVQSLGGHGETAQDPLGETVLPGPFQPAGAGTAFATGAGDGAPT